MENVRPKSAFAKPKPAAQDWKTFLKCDGAGALRAIGGNTRFGLDLEYNIDHTTINDDDAPTRALSADPDPTHQHT